MIFPCGEGNIMILPCGQSAVQTKRGQTALIRSHWATNHLTHPYHGCMDNALVHYTPNSPGRGGLTITYSMINVTDKIKYVQMFMQLNYILAVGSLRCLSI